MPLEKLVPYTYDNNTCIEWLENHTKIFNNDGLEKVDSFEFCKPRDKKFDPNKTNWLRDTFLLGGVSKKPETNYPEKPEKPWCGTPPKPERPTLPPPPCIDIADCINPDKK